MNDLLEAAQRIDALAKQEGEMLAKIGAAFDRIFGPTPEGCIDCGEPSNGFIRCIGCRTEPNP